MSNKQQSSEPVAKPLRNEHGSLIYDGKGNVIYEKTNHPPASVPLEKYNKLLEIMKIAKTELEMQGCDVLEKNDVGYMVHQLVTQAIAEAEEKVG